MTRSDQDRAGTGAGAIATLASAGSGPGPAAADFTDRPVTRPADDWLGRSRLVEALAGALRVPPPDGSLIVGVYGAPGSGKSSVLHLLRAAVVERAPTIWLDAWEQAQPGDVLWRRLLYAVLEALGDEHDGLPAVADTEFRKAMLRREFDDLSALLHRGHRAAPGDGGGAGRAASPLDTLLAGAEGSGPADLLRRLGGKDGQELLALIEQRQHARYREEMLALDRFRARLAGLMLHEGAAPRQGIYIFVDHLDRCPPEAAGPALEALRRHLDLPGSVVLVGLDPLALAGAGGTGADDGPGPAPGGLLETLVELPVRLPTPGRAELEAFVARWCESTGASAIAAAAPVIAAGAPPNPRRIRRILGALRLLEGLRADGRLELLAKLLVLKAGDPGAYRAIVRNPARLRQMEQSARAAAKRQGAQGEPREARRRAEAMLVLDPFFAPLPDDALAALVATTETVG